MFLNFSNESVVHFGKLNFNFIGRYESKCTNLGRVMETHGPKLLGAEYKDPITSFKQFHEFSVEQPEVSTFIKAFWGLLSSSKLSF